jgi:hypothetical protein
VVSFFVVQTYYTIQKDHERLANHETRISVHDTRIDALEDRKGRTSLNTKHIFEGILPDRIEVKQEEN